MGAGAVNGAGAGKLRATQVDKEQNPLYFMDLKDFAELKRFPHYSDPLCFRTVQNVTTLDLTRALVVFVSHAWLRDEREVHSRPDNRDHDCFQLCKEGLVRLHTEYASLLPQCLLWLDYSCVNHTEWVDSVQHRRRLNRQAVTATGRGQDQDPLLDWEQEQDQAPSLTYSRLRLDEILQHCDCVFTPVLREDTWRSLNLSLGHAPPSRVLGWNETPACYMNRAWCRLEMFLAANLPLSRKSTAKCKWFSGPLSAAISAKRRPHFLSGPARSPAPQPQCLPALSSSMFAPLHPLGGAVSNPSDWALLRLLCSRLPPLLARNGGTQLGSSLVRNYDSVAKTGWRNPLGQLHDKNGVVRFGCGDVYKGSVKADVLDGYGVYRHIEGDVYKGDFRNNEMTGQGTYRYADGEKYKGEWLHGMKHGTGTFHFANGDVYHGQWRRNIMHGEGRYEYSAGDVYEGNRVDGVISGYGVMTAVNGDVYSGDFLDGKRHGKGEFRYADGKSRYEGRWVGNVIHGFGEFWSAEGWTYKGMWQNGAQHGQGVFSYTNGDEFRGSTEKGRRHGYGVLKYGNGDCYKGLFADDLREGEECLLVTLPANNKNGVGCTYRGGFLEDKLSGKGEQTYSNGETYVGTFLQGGRLKGVYTKSDGIYDGEWKEDLRDGHGVFLYNSGAKYEGGWKAGQKHGSGEYTSHTGDFFRGYFAQNKFHGYGVLTAKDSGVYKGSWERGQRSGRGQFFYKNGDHFRGVWKENRRAHGRMQFRNGEVFEGAYDELGRQSKGEYKYLSGNKYDGSFKRKERSGFGKFTLHGQFGREIITTAEWSHDFALHTIDVSSYDALPPITAPPSVKLSMDSLEDASEEDEEDEEDEDDEEGETEEEEGEGRCEHSD